LTSDENIFGIFLKFVLIFGSKRMGFLKSELLKGLILKERISTIVWNSS